VPTLRELFDSLSPPAGPPASAAHFSAHPVPGYEAHRIAKDGEGNPCLLLHVVGGTTYAVPPPIVLSHLAVQHDVLCRISRPPQAPEESSFTLLRCLGGNTALVALFLDVMELVVRTVGRAPSVDQVRHTVEELAELFQSLDRPTRKSVQGVWAELFLMAEAGGPGRLAAAWHRVPGEAFDFSEGPERIEVKAATGGARQHHFSLMQVHPPRGVRVFVASLFVEALAGGTPVKSLLGALRGRLAARPELALRVESVTAQTLGRSWESAIEEPFDWERAHESLRFFESHRIPSVARELPSEVSDVRFRSDLSGLAGLSIGEARQHGGLFAAL